MFLLSKIKSIFIFSSLLIFLTGVAWSMEFEDDLCLKAYVFMHDRNEYSSDEKRSKDIQEICADAKVTSIDFSLMNLIDTDLDDIFTGLLQREMIPGSGRKAGLALLNISCEDISECGLTSFIRKLQKGERKNGKKIFPDVRNTVIRIGFPISVEFGQALQTVGPSVFAGSLRLVY